MLLFVLLKKMLMYLISEGHYMTLGMSFGLSIGIVLGMSIGIAFNKEKGIVFGMNIGMVIGMAIGIGLGTLKDNEAKKQDKVLSSTKA